MALFEVRLVATARMEQVHRIEADTPGQALKFAKNFSDDHLWEYEGVEDIAGVVTNESGNVVIDEVE